MPTVRETLSFEAPVERIWRVVSDPHSLPRWWPRVQRAEEVTDDAWTLVLASDRGKSVRADFTLIEKSPMMFISWQQELEETPFERMLSLSQLRIVIERVEEDGVTDVELISKERLRGLARLGAPMVRRATRRRLSDALSRLSELVE